MTKNEPSTAVTQTEAQHKHTLEAASARFGVMPLRFTKVIHLIRHGEGFHNVAGRKDHSNYKSYDYLDSHLTAAGWAQAHALGEHVRAAGLRPQLVVVSPLTRAIETAVGCFGDCFYDGGFSSADEGGSRSCNGSGGTSNGGGASASASAAAAAGGDWLMVELRAEDGKRASHPAVPRDSAPPFLCMELCREHLGVHPCDKRRPLSAIQALFPGVDFSLIESEEDDLWLPDHRETKEEIQARGRLFISQLMARPEREIAVVTHSSFVHYCLTNFGHDASTAVQGDLHRWFENAELRSVVISDPGCMDGHRPDPTHYPGFASHVVEGPEAQ